MSCLIIDKDYAYRPEESYVIRYIVDIPNDPTMTGTRKRLRQGRHPGTVFGTKSNILLPEKFQTKEEAYSYAVHLAKQQLGSKERIRLYKDQVHIKRGTPVYQVRRYYVGHIKILDPLSLRI